MFDTAPRRRRYILYTDTADCNSISLLPRLGWRPYCTDNLPPTSSTGWRRNISGTCEHSVLPVARVTEISYHRLHFKTHLEIVEPLWHLHHDHCPRVSFFFIIIHYFLCISWIGNSVFRYFVFSEIGNQRPLHELRNIIINKYWFLLNIKTRSALYWLLYKYIIVLSPKPPPPRWSLTPPRITNHHPVSYYLLIHFSLVKSRYLLNYFFLLRRCYLSMHNVIIWEFEIHKSNIFKYSSDQMAFRIKYERFSTVGVVDTAVRRKSFICEVRDNVLASTLTVA